MIMIVRPSAIGDDQGLDFLGIKDDYEHLKHVGGVSGGIESNPTCAEITGY